MGASEECFLQTVEPHSTKANIAYVGVKDSMKYQDQCVRLSLFNQPCKFVFIQSLRSNVEEGLTAILIFFQDLYFLL